MSFILINSSNYLHNLKLIESRVKSKEKISIVLKDSAYSHGLMEIAKLALEFGIESAIVRDLDEAKEILELFQRVLILSEMRDFNFFDRRVNYAINSIQKLKEIPSGLNIELKVDSGMARNGVDISDIKRALEIVESRKLNLKGVFTHFRSADILSSELFWQHKNWVEIKNFLKPIVSRDVKFHSFNSASLFRLNSFDDDFVRIGIASYGYLENEYLFRDIDLKPVLSLWGEKIASRFLKKAQRVGYSGAFRADRDMTISTYDIGYADGFFRLNGSENFQTSKNLRVLGKVSMDSMSIEGDAKEVCIFESVESLSKIFNTISYEILVKLSNKIERRVI